MPPQNAQREAADREAIQQRAGKDEAVALDMTREAAMAFLDADADGDHLLDYEEFRMAVPEKMRGQSAEAALRELFATADADGSGQISMSEFFMWTLTIAQSHGGNGLEAVFKRFDRDARGELDSEEFSAACEEMGFGELAGEMFVELDHDDSGTISYSELMGILKGRAHLVSKDCKRFLTTLAFDAAKPSAGGEPRAGSLEAVAQDWALHGADAEALRLELQQKLKEHGFKVSDVYRLMTHAKTVSLSLNAFTSAMVDGLGFDGDIAVLEDVFRDLDADRSGVIGISELFAWVNGKHGKAKLAKTVTLAYGRDAEAAAAAAAAATVAAASADLGLASAADDAAAATDLHASAAQEWTIDRVPWNGPTVLHAEVQLMLLRADLSPQDLIHAYEGYADGGQLSFKQFLKMMKRVVSPSEEDIDLWDTECRPAVQDAFRAIHVFAAESAERRKIFSATIANPERMAEVRATAAAAGGGGESSTKSAAIALSDLERWLTKGWARRKSQREQERAAARLALHRATHPDEAAAADAAAAKELAEAQQVAAAEAARAAERLAYRAALAGAPPRSHRELDREVDKILKAKKAAAREEAAAAAMSGKGGAHGRGLPPVSTTTERILGRPTKEYLQLAARIAEEGGKEWLMKPRLAEARRKHERAVLEEQQAALRARSQGRRPPSRVQRDQYHRRIPSPPLR